MGGEQHVTVEEARQPCDWVINVRRFEETCRLLPQDYQSVREFITPMIKVVHWKAFNQIHETKWQNATNKIFRQSNDFREASFTIFK